MIEMLDAAIENSYAYMAFGFLMIGSFCVAILCVLFSGLALRLAVNYTVRTIRRRFVEGRI